MEQDPVSFPQSLEDIRRGSHLYGDEFGEHRLCGHAKEPHFFKPPWFDSHRFHSGQTFFSKNISGILFSFLCALIAGFVVESLTEALTFTGLSVGVDKSRKRYTETLRHLALWHRGDIFESQAKSAKSIQKVGRMHEVVRRRINHLNVKNKMEDDYFTSKNDKNNEHYNVLTDDNSRHNNDWSSNETYDVQMASEKTEIPLKSSFNGSKASCPIGYRMQNSSSPLNSALSAEITGENSEVWCNKMNQFDMALVQSGFIGPIVMHPEAFGIAPHDPGLSDYVYFWRVVGYVLGLKDQFNICAGGLQWTRKISFEIEMQIIAPQMQVASRNSIFHRLTEDFIEGMQCLIPLLAKAPVIAYIDNLMEIDGRCSMTFRDWMIYYLYSTWFWLCLQCDWFKQFQLRLFDRFLLKLCDDFVI